MRIQAQIKIIGMLIVCLIAVDPTAKAAPFRKYEAVNGRMVSGKVLRYDPKTEDVIFLRQADNQLLRANLSAFAPKERKFIRDWAVAKEFMTGLTISGKLRWKKDKNLSDEKKLVQTASYDILFNSTTGYPFGKVQVEYCIYYRQGRPRGQGMIFDRGVCHGTGEVKLETVQQKDNLETKPITLYFLLGPSSVFGVSHDVEGAVSGIWIRAKVLLPSGQPCIREYRSSMESNWKWSSKSIPVGMNENEKTAPSHKDAHWLY